MGKNMAVTLKDVARKLDMAPSSISRILREDPRAGEFREETRKRVHAIARELGYTRNLSAATMRNGFNSSTIAVLLNESEDFIYPVVLRLIKNLNKQGFGVRIYCDDDIHAIFQEIESNQIWYIINFKRLKPDLDFSSDYCRRNGLKMAIARNERLYADFPVFGSNDRQIMHDMVAYLYRLGHRKIALYCGSHENKLAANTERHAGFLEALKKFRLEECTDMIACPLDFSREICLDLLRQYMPTAICCADSSLALKIELLLRDFGVRIPENISLIAFGNDPNLLQYSYPQFTSMKETEQGEMLDDILQYFRSGPPQKNDGVIFSRLCNAVLLERGSTAPPNPMSQLYPKINRSSLDRSYRKHK